MLYVFYDNLNISFYKDIIEGVFFVIDMTFLKHWY